MAFSDKWTRAQLRDSCRLELQDPAGRFWSDDELNGYIISWQDTLQDKFEFVWATDSFVTSSSTFTIGSGVHRLDAVYLNNWRLSGRSKYDLDRLQREWRDSSVFSGGPSSVFQNDSLTFSLWPPLSTTGTIRLEYPAAVSLASDAAIMSLPAWVKYSCRNYVTYRSLLRDGPASNANKASYYKRRWMDNLKMYTTMYANYLPDRAPRLRPASEYDWDILKPPPGFTVVPAMAASTFNDYVPTGIINGTNRVFTLPVTPTELQLFRNGQLQQETTDYIWSGYTITFTEGRQPQTGDTLIAWVFRG